MTAYGFVSQSFPFMVEKLEIACVAAANGKIDLQRRRRIARPVRECVEMSVRSDRVLAALRTFAVYVCLVVVHQHTVVRFHRCFGRPLFLFGVVKAAPDDLPGAQLKLYVEPRHVRSEIDLHDVTLCPHWLTQIDDGHLLTVFETCGYQFLGGRVGEVRVQQSIGIAYLAWTPVRRPVPLELGDAGCAAPCEQGQLMPRRAVDSGRKLSLVTGGHPSRLISYDARSLAVKSEQRSFDRTWATDQATPGLPGAAPRGADRPAGDVRHGGSSRRHRTASSLQRRPTS